MSPFFGPVVTGQRVTNATGSTALGILAGVAYGVGSLTGQTQTQEWIAGKDFMTGESLHGLNRTARLFSGISNGAFAWAGGLEAARVIRGRLTPRSIALDVLNREGHLTPEFRAANGIVCFVAGTQV